MNEIKQETTKQALSQITQTNPLMALVVVAVMSGAGGLGGASLFGGNEQTMTRISELEKTQVAHGAALRTMEGQQTKIDRTLHSLTTAVNELAKTTAVMNATLEGMKQK